MRPIALYLHIPFCRRKCSYCAFHSLERWRPAAADRITEAILADVERLADRMPAVRTLYVGGGTPTVLDAQRLRSIVERPVRLGAAPVEVSVEANPESATTEMLAVLAAAGVHRLSIGVQTFDPPAAETLGRRLTTPREIERIRAEWPNSLAADLIHAVPGAAPGATAAAIGTLASIGIDHLSVYDLSIEPSTPLAAELASGRLRAVDADDEWPAIVRQAESLGLRRYEVSNFARPGKECEHNRAYWRAEDYLGLGPSAVSTLYDRDEDGAVRHARRIVQPSDHASYLLRRHPFDGECEHLGPRELLQEIVMLGLRTTDGVACTRLERVVTPRSWTRCREELGALATEGLLAGTGSHIRATHRGLDLLNRVVGRILAVLDY